MGSITVIFPRKSANRRGAHRVRRSSLQYRWADGARLEQVLWESDLTPGDFVRWCKQVLDMLGQLQHLGVADLAATARQAADAVSRSVVSYSGVA